MWAVHTDDESSVSGSLHWIYTAFQPVYLRARGDDQSAGSSRRLGSSDTCGQDLIHDSILHSSLLCIEYKFCLERFTEHALTVVHSGGLVCQMQRAFENGKD